MRRFSSNCQTRQPGGQTWSFRGRRKPFGTRTDGPRCLNFILRFVPPDPKMLIPAHPCDKFELRMMPQSHHSPVQYHKDHFLEKPTEETCLQVYRDRALMERSELHKKLTR